jgi:hypothetical protein
VIVVELHFIAPIPTGHRVQVLRIQRWTAPLFGGPAAWEEQTNPLVVDLESGVIYGESYLTRQITANPLAFRPNTGFQVGAMTEGRVTACIVGSDGGSSTSLLTQLYIETPQPQGAYR